MKIEHRKSYETIKFDTPDGDLHKGQYAEHNGVYLVRNHPENNHQPEFIDPREDLDYLVKLAGLTKVNVIPNEHMYYDEYALPNGRMFRVPSSQQNYRKRELIGFVEPVKDVTAKKIEEIVKDDDKWL